MPFALEIVYNYMPKEGLHINWSVISGESINVGSNFSCDTCHDPWVKINATTHYKATTDINNGCYTSDSIIVTVAPNFTYNINHVDTTCMYMESQISINTSPSGNYTYLWDYNNRLSDRIISNPTYYSYFPGNYILPVNITNSQGCQKRDSIEIVVVELRTPVLSSSFSDTTINCDDSLQMDVNIIGGVYDCLPYFSGSNGQDFTTFIIGTSASSNGNTIYPAPFGNWYKTAKHQFLFRASELSSAGVLPGIISEIAWETTAQNNATNNFNDFSIKIGCTSQTELTQSFEQGLTQVFSPQDISVSLGWNNFQLNPGYMWDGFSNLIVEICFDNSDTSYTRNWSTPFEATNYNSTNYFINDGLIACQENYSSGVVAKRPITRFTTFELQRDTGFVLQWSPTNDLTNSNILNPIATPTQNTNYQLVAVTNTHACPSDTLSIAVNVNELTVNTIPDTIICNGESITLNTQSIATNYQWSPNSQLSSSSVSNPVATPTTNTQYTVIGSTAAGCAGYDTVNIEVKNTSSSTLNITSCDEYSYLGKTYTNSGIYYDTLTNSIGCDSIITLDLEIKNSSTYTDIISACEEYTWLNGFTYRQSNNQSTYTIPNSVGCDSVISLDLTIYYDKSTIETHTACDQFTWIDGSTFTQNNNTAAITFPSVNGCDSVVHLDLTINNSMGNRSNFTSCSEVLWNGNLIKCCRNLYPHWYNE